MSIKISELPSAEAVNNSDYLAIVQDGTTKKATASMLSADIATTINSSSTNNTAAGAKAVYDYAAPKKHDSTAQTYGVGTDEKYGHVMLVDDLNSSSLQAGKALSSHQGYVIKGLLDDKQDIINGYNKIDADFVDDTTSENKFVTEEQKQEIEELKAENEALLDQIPTATAEGEFVHAEDSSNLPPKDFAMSGNATQETTTGKNKIPTQVDKWEQGTLTNGLPNDSDTRIRTKEFYSIERNTNYHISVENTSYAFLNIWVYDSSYNVVEQYYNKNNNINGTTSLAIDFDDEHFPNAVYIKVILKKANNGNIAPSEVESAKPMLELGPSRTPYEPYTGGKPAPNPDYPQDIHVVTGDNTFAVNGKNLLPTNQIRTDKSWLTVNSDGSIKIEYASGSNINFTNLFTSSINLPINNYKLKLFVTGTFSGGNMLVLGENNTSVSQASIIDGRIITITNHGINNIQLYIVSAGTNCTIKLELEQGTTEPTSYEPYITPQTQLISLGSIELAKIPDTDITDVMFKAVSSNNPLKPSYYDTLPSGVKATLTVGSWYKQGNIVKLILNGSESGWVSLDSSIPYRLPLPDFILPSSQSAAPYIMNNRLPVAAWNSNSNYPNYFCSATSNEIYARFRNTDVSNLAEFKTWLSTNNNELYYASSVPTYTEITDTTLIAQLENVLKMHTNKNVTNAWIEPSGTNAQAGMVLVYRQDLATLISAN